jgi:transposase
MKINEKIKVQIQTLRDIGYGYGAISKQLNLNRSTIAKHCEKMDHLSKLPPKEKVYKGKIKGRDVLKIKKYIIWNPTDSLGDIINGCDLNVSQATLSRYLKRMDMPSKVAKRRIVMTEVNKLKRVQFAKRMLKKSDEWLSTIWFSDETIVKSRPNGEIVFYRCPPGDEWYEPSNASGGNSVMFWGLISKAAYGPLVEVVGKNTAQSYIGTLKEYLLPEIQAAGSLVTFQQDNASIHKTAAVMAFLEETQVNTIDWPPQSPDLSPIENIWNIMKMKLKALKPRPRSHAEMRDAMLKIWSELADNLREHLVGTFRTRLKLCIKAKGELIKFNKKK